MKIQLREVKYPAQGHTAEKQQGLNLNLGLPGTKTCVLTTTSKFPFMSWGWSSFEQENSFQAQND